MLRFTIHDPKERLIYKLPYYPDRIVHHAIMNILEPIWTSLFIKNTYSCIKNRGIHKAMMDIKESLKDESGTKYCLKIDIKKFYPSINHEILKLIIRKKIKDRELLELLDEIIDSTEGVPIGNYLSQYFANLYLTYFDHWIKEVKHIKYYFRYADDMIFFAEDKQTLFILLESIKQYMKRLSLVLKGNEQVFPIEKRGLDFIGFIFRHKYVLLRKRIKQNMCRKIIKLQYITDIKTYIKEISPYIGWIKYSNSKNLFKKIINKSYYETCLRYTKT